MFPCYCPNFGKCLVASERTLNWHCLPYACRLELRIKKHQTTAIGRDVSFATRLNPIGSVRADEYHLEEMSPIRWQPAEALSTVAGVRRLSRTRRATRWATLAINYRSRRRNASSTVPLLSDVVVCALLRQGVITALGGTNRNHIRRMLDRRDVVRPMLQHRLTLIRVLRAIVDTADAA
jgi:hypothetical protein